MAHPPRLKLSLVLSNPRDGTAMLWEYSTDAPSPSLLLDPHFQFARIENTAAAQHFYHTHVDAFHRCRIPVAQDTVQPIVGLMYHFQVEYQPASQLQRCRSNLNHVLQTDIGLEMTEDLVKKTLLSQYH